MPHWMAFGDDMNPYVLVTIVGIHYNSFVKRGRPHDEDKEITGKCRKAKQGSSSESIPVKAEGSSKR